MGGDPILGQRALNRALLDRQFLLRRSRASVPEVVEQLVGLQAQAPLPPYLALWSRMQDLNPHEIGGQLTSRKLVRVGLMRSTVHMVTARDALWLRPLVQPVLERIHSGAYRQRMGGAELDQLAEAVNALLADGPLLELLAPDVALRDVSFDPPHVQTPGRDKATT